MVDEQRTWKTTALVVTAVAAVLVLVWKLRSSQKPPAAPKKKIAVEGPNARHEAERLPPLAGGAARASEINDDEPPSRSVPATDEQTEPIGEDNTNAKPMAQLLRGIPAKMKKAAKHCFDPARHPANSAERVSFRYTILYEGGEARVSTVIPVDTSIEDEDLQNCILDSVQQMAWPASGAPDRSSPRQQLSISIYDLAR